MAFRDPVISAVAGTTSTTTHTPAQPDNQSGDLLLLWIGFVNNAGPPTVTTPAGWTLQLGPVTQDDTRIYLFWKESTGSESFPDLTLSSAREATMLSGVFPDVDFVSGPFGDTAQVTSTNNAVFGSVTTTQANSWVAYFMTMHRRNLGFNSNNKTINTVFAGGAQSGNTTNADTYSQAAYDFAGASGSTLTPLRPSQSEDNIKYTFEILTNGNNIPVLFDANPIGSQPTPTPAQGADDSFRDAFTDSGYSFRGAHSADRTFDASTADTVNNRITVTGHGYDEAWVVRLDANGATPPTGLADGSYYQVKPVDADTLELVNVDAIINAGSEFYMSGSTKRATTAISAVGSGTCSLKDCGMLFSMDGNNIDRWNSASGGPGSFSGTWNGNAVGPDGLAIGYSRTFSTARDMTNDILYLTMTYGSSDADFEEQGLLFIDDNNEWIAFSAYEAGAGAANGFGNSARPTLVKMSDVAQFASLPFARKSGGTFDVTQVKHMVYYNQGNFANVQSETNNNIPDPLLWTPPVVYGGSATNPITWDLIAKAIQDRLTDYFADVPADQSVVILRCPVTIGGSGFATHLAEDAKALAVPTIGDNAVDFRIYIRDFEIVLDLQSGDTFTQTNTLLSASNTKVTERHTINSGATANFNGRLFSNLNPEFDADVTYSRPTVLGAETVQDNNATISGGFFGVSDAVGADNGLITWGASTAISGSTFELNAGVTTGHAIIITTPGTYTFTDLTFTGFGADASVTAAVYNNSGGSVTINISGGSSPTVRNGAGASTTVNSSVSVDVTVTDASGSAIQDARVFLREAGGGATIVNALSNASGAVAGSYSGSTPQAVEGWVRKATSGTLYKQFTLGGSVSASGYSATAIMAEDQ